jgi:hypothetical protein
MEKQRSGNKKSTELTVNGPSANRRAFLKKGVLGVGAATVAAGLLPGGASAIPGQEGPVTKGDIAILTFLSALEQVEADLWIQYAELGGPTPNVPTSFGLSPIDLQLNGTKINTGIATNYVTALQTLDTDMPQYIADNTDDEISHHRFLNNYLQSKGAAPVDLSQFAILPPSGVTGVPNNGRLTNLKQLTIDTSWWTRNRSETQNPDFGGGPFANVIPDLAKAPHTAIPLDDNDLGNTPGVVSNHLQAIASTAGFHFAFIEQGGSSLYPSLAQKVTNLEVLRVLLSIGASEIMHFQTWHDKAGNAPPLTDGNLTFPPLDGSVDPNLPAGTPSPQPQTADAFQLNLIMPEPTVFLNPAFGPVSILRPTSDALGGAVASVVSFVQDGLFRLPNSTQNTGIVDVLMKLAEAADAARRLG